MTTDLAPPYGEEHAALCIQRDEVSALIASPDSALLPVGDWMRLQHEAISLSKRIFLIEQAADSKRA